MKDETTAWAVMSANGKIDVTSVRNFRKEAIEKWLKGGSYPWRWYYNKGCRAVKVKISTL